MICCPTCRKGLVAKERLHGHELRMTDAEKATDTAAVDAFNKHLPLVKYQANEFSQQIENLQANEAVVLFDFSPFQQSYKRWYGLVDAMTTVQCFVIVLITHKNKKLFEDSAEDSELAKKLHRDTSGSSTNSWRFDYFRQGKNDFEFFSRRYIQFF